MNSRSNKINWSAMADPAIVIEICNCVKQMRLNKNISQEQLALLSGLNRTTISRMEAGRSVTLLTLVQVLRALDKMDILNVFREEPEISPMQMLKQLEKQRKKASHKKGSKK